MRHRLLGRPEDAPRPPPVPGVIDTIGLGYSQLIARPYVVALPVIVDLYLWLGPRAIAEPLISAVAGRIRDRGSVGSEAADNLERLESFNLFELLSLRLPIARLPTLVPLLNEPANLPGRGWAPELGALSPWSTPALAILLAGAGFVVGGAYLQSLLAVAEGRSLMPDWKEWLRVARELAIWVVVAVGLVLLVTAPLIAAQVALLALGFGGFWLLLFLAFFPLAWGFLMFFFSAQAIVVDHSTAMQAFRSSYQVVRRHLGQSAGFIAAYLLVTSGFPLLWSLMLNQPAGVLIAIIGNAFIVSGMISAAMLFYRDRARLIAPVTER